MATSGVKPMTFQDLKAGMRARVVDLDCGAEGVDRLLEMGLTKGAVFEVVKVAPFGDPVEIKLRGYRLCLRKVETAHVEIEPLADH